MKVVKKNRYIIQKSFNYLPTLYLHKEIDYGIEKFTDDIEGAKVLSIRKAELTKKLLIDKNVDIIRIIYD